MKGVLAAWVICLLGSCSYKVETVEHLGYKSGTLVHTVILKVKDETTEKEKNEILLSLESLAAINETNALFVAQKKDTHDPRAKVDYDFILQMCFDSIESLEKYSNNPFHLKVREALKLHLGAPPVVYDYVVN